MFSIVDNGSGANSVSSDDAVIDAAGNKGRAEAMPARQKQTPQARVRRTPARARYPVNLLESEIGEEVSELLAHPSLQLTSGHQAWLLMAIMYLVERERRKAVGPSSSAERACAMARAQSLPARSL
jgi:hypothetical protein